MWCLGSILFLFTFYFQYIISCKNFQVQSCTDIPIKFKSISTIKCLQLIPIIFDISFDYSVKNYVVSKGSQCYNILSFESPSITIFSNECKELCPDEYCQLFDNQLNTSIINIFYSSLLTYEYATTLTYDTSSFDYLLFDQCSSANHTNRILFIVVFTLCGIIVALSIVVIAKYLIAIYLKKYRRGRPYSPYDIYWILDCILCRIEEIPEPSNESSGHSNRSDSIENIPIQPRNIVTPSTPIQIHYPNSSNNTNNQISYSSHSSSKLYYGESPSANTTPRTIHRDRYGSTDTENDSEINKSPIQSRHPRHQLIIPPALQTISQQISATLSNNSDTSHYKPLERKETPSIVNFRV